MQKPAHEIYSFDEFRLDLTRGALFRGVDEIKLRPKSFDVLKYLTENQGRLVSKDELIERVWNGTAVTDDSLVQCMKDIRRALGDDEQQIIKTVPRRGYIFEKEVTENGLAIYSEEISGVHLVIEETEETNEHGVQISGQRQLAVGRKSLIDAIKRHKTATAVASLSLVAVVILTGIIFYRPVLAWWFKPPSIAVLPIVNTTGDAELDYVSDGLTESIITSLVQLNEGGKTPRLRVIAQNTVFIFKGKEIEPRSVGRELGVDTVLASKMFRQAGLRIFKFEMINVADGSIMWSKQYSSGLNQSEFLATQDEIPREIAAHLPVSLSDADRENLTRRYTQNAEAYDLYLKGRSEFRRVTPSGLRKSIEFYQQAIDLDADFALAYWAMGVSSRTQGGIDERSDKEAKEKAVDLFQKALRIDNNLTVANNAMKLNEADAWDWKELEKVGPANPGYREYLIATGRLDEQIENEKRQLLVNPYGPLLNFTHCNTLLLARRNDEAIAQCRKTLNLVPAADQAYFGPESPWIHLYLALAYSWKEMYAEAIAEGRIAVDLGEKSKTLLAELGTIYARSGQRDEAIKILKQLQERADSGEYAPAFNIAGIYAALGDKDQAFAWLNKAFDERENRLGRIKVEPNYDPLRDDPRFVELLRRLNLPS